MGWDGMGWVGSSGRIGSGLGHLVDLVFTPPRNNDPSSSGPPASCRGDVGKEQWSRLACLGSQRKQRKRLDLQLPLTRPDPAGEMGLIRDLQPPPGLI